MDGYSVKDAAVVLGIPERRVWELLARGVLAGAPEGPDGMIVFLQPRSTPASVSTAEAAGEPAGPKVNGNGGSNEFSPFRELLTEFRNLTERYGQALLALGEARGEVASLRSRVELLEARMDLRLPSSPPASTVAWELPEFAAEEVPAPAPAAEPPIPEQPIAFEADEPLVVDEMAAFEADELVVPEEVAAFESEEFVAEEPTVAEVEESVAGEDEPAAEPMIDLIEEAVIAEALLDDEAPISSSIVREMAAEEDLVIEEMPAAGAALPEEPEADTQPLEAAGHELPESEAPEPAAAASAEAPDETEDLEPPRRRARGGRTATAGFAAALARADDPTIAELPGAEETAAALAALQREIDGTRDAEPAVEADTAAVESEAAVEAEPIVEEEAPQVEPEAAFEPEVFDEPAAVAEPVAQAAEPARPSVPSYYSTDVVDPDWFADGDFSWLEAAQAEAARVEAAQAEPSVQEAQPDEAVEQPAGLAAEPEPSDVEQPDLEHGGFEPSAESQALAEEEARSAMEEAFEEVPAASELEQPEETGPAVAVATAVAQAEPEAEVEAEAIQDAFEPPSEPEPAAENVHAQHEGEVEAEAIQEAFEEPMPAPAWPSEDASPATEEPEAPDAGAATYAPPPVDEPTPSVDEAPRAFEEAPPTMAAASTATAVRGPEEFIAPAPPATTPPPAPQPATHSQPASGEEELMWLGDEFEEADLEVAAQGWRSPETESATPAKPIQPLELSDAELTQLAEDEGWDNEEVEAIRRLLGRPSDAPPPEPAGPVTPSAAERRAEASYPTAEPRQPAESRPSTPSPEAWSPTTPNADDDPEWLEGRGGAAAEAYRRLRKLFPS